MSRPSRARVCASNQRFLSYRVLYVCLTFLCVCSTRSVAASELVIEWTAPPDCPDQDDFVSRVERSLGAGVKANLTAKAHVTEIAGTFHAKLRISSSAGYGERVLENTRCEILADSVALVVAMSASRSGEMLDDEQERFALALSAHGTAIIGPLPKIALGVGGALAIEAFAFRLELSGTYYAPPQSSTFDSAPAGAEFKLLRFSARACRVWKFGAFELAPCLGAQFFRIDASAFGGEEYLDASSLVWGPSVGVFGRLRVWGPLSVFLEADGFAPVSRQRFVYSDLGPLHRPSAVGGQLFIAPEVQF
jgi:hypothetical protein